MKVLVVDDSFFIRKQIEKILKDSEYELLFAEDGAQALEMIDTKKPEIILLDWVLPHGIQGPVLCEEIQSTIEKDYEAYLFLIIMTSKSEISDLEYAIDKGADLFIEKPLNARILKKYVEIGKKHVEKFFVHEKAAIKKELEFKTKVYRGISKIAGVADDDTGKHTERIAYYSKKFAMDLKMSIDFVYEIGLSSPLHDIGKIAISRDILKKPGKLTKEEFDIMKTHTSLGKEILDAAGMTMAANIAYCHHENWDGSGYPRGIRGNDIPIEAQIVSIIDVYDALRQRRIYKESWTNKQTMEFLKENSGKKFNPKLIEVFMNNENNQYNEIFNKYGFEHDNILL